MQITYYVPFVFFFCRCSTDSKTISANRTKLNTVIHVSIINMIASVCVVDPFCQLTNPPGNNQLLVVENNTNTNYTNALPLEATVAYSCKPGYVRPNGSFSLVLATCTNSTLFEIRHNLSADCSLKVELISHINFLAKSIIVKH